MSTTTTDEFCTSGKCPWLPQNSSRRHYLRHNNETHKHRWHGNWYMEQNEEATSVGKKNL